MDSVAKLPAKDRAALFRAAETELVPPIAGAIIEKDFWVCWTLHRLFTILKIEPQLIFKGGTSLSKAFKVVERFSEDVDLSLSRGGLGFTGKNDPEESKISGKERGRRIEALREKCRSTVKGKLLPELRADFESILGPSGWSIEPDKDDADTLDFSYPASDLTKSLDYVRSFVRLELGARSDDWPETEAEITPYAAEAFPQTFKQPSCRVRTLIAERTFWEKAVLLHAESHRPEDKATDDKTVSRHYYDLYCLSRHDIGEKALARIELLERVAQHTALFFPRGWANYEAAKKGTIRLVPNEKRIEALRKDYAAMKGMMFGQPPKWDEIIEELKQLESRING